MPNTIDCVTNVRGQPNVSGGYDQRNNWTVSAVSITSLWLYTQRIIFHDQSEDTPYFLQWSIYTGCFCLVVTQYGATDIATGGADGSKTSRVRKAKRHQTEYWPTEHNSRGTKKHVNSDVVYTLDWHCWSFAYYRVYGPAPWPYCWVVPQSVIGRSPVVTVSCDATLGLSFRHAHFNPL